MDETRGIGLHVQPGRREKKGIFKTVKLKAVPSSIFPQKVSSQGETQGQRTPIGRQGINTGKVFTQMAVKEKSLDRGQPRGPGEASVQSEQAKRDAAEAHSSFGGMLGRVAEKGGGCSGYLFHL